MLVTPKNTVQRYRLRGVRLSILIYASLFPLVLGLVGSANAQVGTANEPLSTSQVQNVLDTTMNIPRVGLPNCNAFTSVSELISFICEKVEHEPIEAVFSEAKKRGAEDLIRNSPASSLSLPDFESDFKFFMKQSGAIPNLLKEDKSEAWSLDHNRDKNSCRFTSSDTFTKNFIEAKINNVTFEGAHPHWSSLQPDKRATAKSELLERIKTEKPDAFLLEGATPFGRAVSCKDLLKNVFTSDADFDLERNLIVKYGFLNKIALIPADHQNASKLDKKDVTIKLDFMGVLHSDYMASLRKEVNPLAWAFKDAEQHKGSALTFTTSADFLKFYEQQNHRKLPIEVSEIYNDMTPASYVQGAPKGTNNLAEFQEGSRNPVLLNAIRITSKAYSHPMVVFGASHLTEIGSAWELETQQKAKIDYKTSCPDRK